MDSKQSMRSTKLSVSVISTDKQVYLCHTAIVLVQFRAHIFWKVYQSCFQPCSRFIQSFVIFLSAVVFSLEDQSDWTEAVLVVLVKRSSDQKGPANKNPTEFCAHSFEYHTKQVPADTRQRKRRIISKDDTRPQRLNVNERQVCLSPSESTSPILEWDRRLSVKNPASVQPFLDEAEISFPYLRPNHYNALLDAYSDYSDRLKGPRC